MRGKAFRAEAQPRAALPHHENEREYTALTASDQGAVAHIHDWNGTRPVVLRRVRQRMSQSSIVIIESSLMIGQAFARSLEMATGVPMVVAATVSQCIEMTGSSSVAAVVHLALSEGGLRQVEQQIESLCNSGSAVPSIILSSTDDVPDIIRAIDIGAKGFIPTSMSLGAVGMSIRLVMEGSVFVPATSLIGPRCAQYSEPLQPKGIQTASLESYFPPRQAAVVEAICRGKANKIIAFDLGMSESTVKVHVRNIMKKLRAHNRTEVAYLANELLAGSRLPERN